MHTAKVIHKVWSYAALQCHLAGRLLTRWFGFWGQLDAVGRGVGVRLATALIGVLAGSVWWPYCQTGTRRGAGFQASFRADGGSHLPEIRVQVIKLSLYHAGPAAPRPIRLGTAAALLAGYCPSPFGSRSAIRPRNLPPSSSRLYRGYHEVHRGAPMCPRYEGSPLVRVVGLAGFGIIHMLPVSCSVTACSCKGVSARSGRPICGIAQMRGKGREHCGPD